MIMIKSYFKMYNIFLYLTLNYLKVLFVNKIKISNKG